MSKQQKCDPRRPNLLATPDPISPKPITPRSAVSTLLPKTARSSSTDLATARPTNSLSNVFNLASANCTTGTRNAGCFEYRHNPCFVSSTIPRHPSPNLALLPANSEQ